MIGDDERRTIENSVLCWLATSDKHGQPNVSPKEAFCAYGERQILIAEIASPQSKRNIEQNAQVCVSCVDVFAQKGHKFIGEAELVIPNDDQWPALHAALFQIIGPHYPIRSVINISIQKTQAIIAPSYRLFPHKDFEERKAEAMKNYGVEPIARR